jgi:hypothetical protein
MLSIVGRLASRSLGVRSSLALNGLVWTFSRLNELRVAARFFSM